MTFDPDVLQTFAVWRMFFVGEPRPLRRDMLYPQDSLPSRLRNRR